jgi:hypothetical protein
MNARGGDFEPPPVRTKEQLATDLDVARNGFIEWRLKGSTAEYVNEFKLAERTVRSFFEATADLSAFEPSVLTAEPAYRDVARFLCGPPISDDDLKTLVGRSGRAQIADLIARRIVDVTKSAWDPMRFPWTQVGRPPSAQERETAIRWTAGVWAVERLRTKQRNSLSRLQEGRVVRSLHECGLLENRELLRQPIRGPGELEPGSFVPGEVRLAKTKCDVLARLHDGRLLPIECKVSNTAINSYKRLNNETVAKAEKWRKAFGDQVVTVSVLSGIFKLDNVLDAQDKHGIFIVWDHDLSPLTRFISAAR